MNKMETQLFLGDLSKMNIHMTSTKPGCLHTVLKDDKILALVVDHLWYKMSNKLMQKETRYDRNLDIYSDFFVITLDKNTENPSKFSFERPRL